MQYNNSHDKGTSFSDSLRSLSFQYCRLGKLLNIPKRFLTCECYFTEFAKVRANHGNTVVLKLFKYYYDVVKSLSLGTILPSSPTFLWIRTDKSGVPSFVNRLVNISGTNFSQTNDQRFILSLFSAYEIGSVTNPVADLKSLTEPQKSFWNPLTVSKFEAFMDGESHLSNLGADLSWNGVGDYVSLKGGPLGASTPSWTQDLLALYLNPRMLNSVIEIEKILCFEGTSSIASAMKFLPDITNDGSIITSRDRLPLLVTQGIPDKGPKTRTITKGNYYIQRSLKPIHNYVMNVLKRIPEDGTYQQDKAALRVKNWTQSGLQPYCYDLTAATDRMPIDIQYNVLRLLGCPVLTQWMTIMNRSVSYDESRKVFFTFNVGQPMGLYSSWPVFSLTHHYLVRFAFHLNSVSPDDGYSIIGDDCAILDKTVAETYQQLILGLGVDISITKSIIPSNCQEGKCVGELAKRLFMNGVEISPVRARDLLSLRNSSDSWTRIKDFGLEISRRWGSEFSWKLMYCGLSKSSSIPSMPLLSFLKESGKHRIYGRDLLESPFGGPRFHFFTREIVNKESKRIDSIPGNIKILPSFWAKYSNEWIGYAEECVIDKRLDSLMQKLSDILGTFKVLSKLEEDPTISKEFRNFQEFHDSIWFRLDVNPFYQAVKLVEQEIASLFEIPFIFRTTPAAEIVPQINDFSVQIDLIYDWMSGKVKRDISDLKVKRRLATAENMLEIQKYCQEKQLEFISLTSREIPEPSSFDDDSSVNRGLINFKVNKVLKLLS